MANEANKTVPEFMQPCPKSPMKRDCNEPKMTHDDMSGERYRCPICGYSYFLDYEEMR